MIKNQYINLYVNFLKNFLKIKKPLKVVFDCSNGTAGIILKELFPKSKVKNQKLKLNVFLINESPDGNFPAHGPNPLVQGVLIQIKREVILRKADLGIIFDADADRAFFIDNQGRFVESDIIAYLLFWRFRPSRGIITVITGWLIKRFLAFPSLSGRRINLIESRVGHYFIKKIMRKLKAELGAELSGHYYFKKFFYSDSGIMAALEAINAVSDLPYNLSDFVDLLPVYHRSGELNFLIEKSDELLMFMEKKYRGQAEKISHLDGLTMEFNDWWFNLRSSNTEPLIRLNIESADRRLFNDKLFEIKKIIKKFQQLT